MSLGSHGSTFGGNPLAMAVANEVLNFVLNEDFLDHVREVGYNLRKLLKSEIVKKFPKLVSGVRGIGLIYGIELPSNELDYHSVSKSEFMIG